MTSVRFDGSESSGEPSQQQLDAWRRRRSRPDNEVPHPLTQTALLARTADAALAVVGVAAYSTGISFRLAVRLRTRPPEFRPNEMYELVGGGWSRDDDNSKQLLLGVEYSDGRRASNMTSFLPSEPDLDPETPLLRPGNGSGSGLTYDMEYWLTPVPPDGPVMVVCAWPIVGIEETSVVLDDAAFTTASALAVSLWPEQPLETPGRSAPPEPPACGWFAGSTGPS